MSYGKWQKGESYSLWDYVKFTQNVSLDAMLAMSFSRSK